MNKLNSLAPLTLILGGQRSGKSAYGESLIDAHGMGGVYLATTDSNLAKQDDEMLARINAHQIRRGQNWDTVEEAIDIKSAIGRIGGKKPILLDSLGMWVANMLEAGRYPEDEAENLAQALASHPAPVVVISEETGLGLIPENALGRNFVDALGILNQTIGAVAENVVLCVAAIPLIIKKKEQ